jgi:putative transposase
MFECRINTASSCVSSNRDKPIQNAYAESFIGKFRDECLNENWFGSLGDARRTIEAWRRHYNEHRPHSSLGYLPPSAFATCQRKLKHATLTVDSP